MRTIEGSLLTEKKTIEHVSHYESPHHTATQEVTVDGSNLSLHSVGESTGRIISIMHSNGFPSQTLCRQTPGVGDLTADGWGADLLETETSTGSDPPLSEEDRRLTAALIQFVQQNGRNPTVHDLTHIAKEEHVELRTSIIEVSNQPTLPSLPPLPLLKRAPISDWYPTKSSLQYNPKTYLIKDIEEAEGVLQTEECEIEVTNANTTLVHTKQQHHNKKSLPHKKRISRKLKKPHNTNQLVNGQNQFPIDVQQTVEIIQDVSHHQVLDLTEHHPLQTAHIVDPTTHGERALFICQLCGDFFGGDQMQFYHHLKEHYEPHNTTIIIENPMGTIQHHTVMDKMAVSNAPLPDALVELSLEATVPDKSLYETQEKLTEYDTDNKIFLNATEKVSLFTNEKIPVYHQAQKQNQRKLYASLASLEKPLFACIHCPKAFRRQKQYELHIREAHSKVDEMSEFSEPEDLMEGIHVVVEPENEEYLQEEISSHHSNTMMMQTTIGGQEQYILPHLTIDNGHVNQEHLNNKEWYMKQALSKDPGVRDSNSNSISDGECEIRLHDNEGNDDSDEENDGEISCPLCGGLLPGRKQYAEHAQQCHQHLNEEVQRMMEVEAEGNEINAVDADGGLEEEERIDEIEEEIHSDKSNDDSSGKKKNVLTCPECDRTFRHRNSLIYHMLSHSGARTFVCSTCKKSFFTSGALKVHERLHSGDKPYKCESCGRMFRQWGDLKYHFISIHSNQKQHQCEYCGKDFARKYSLIVHRRIHTGEKNYRCDFCDKSFRASSYLQNHRRIHTGEKPHPCSVCGKRFRMKGDMKRHLSTHMKEKIKYADDDKSSEVEEKPASAKRTKNKPITLNEVAPKKEMKIEKQENQEEEDSSTSQDGKDGQTLSEEGISSNESSTIPVHSENRLVSTFPADNTPMYMWPVFT